MADLNKYLGSGGNGVKLHDLRDRIRTADESELRELLKDVEPELLNLRTQAMLQQSNNPMRQRQVLKLVARIHTELGARSRKAANS